VSPKNLILKALKRSFDPNVRTNWRPTENVGYVAETPEVLFVGGHRIVVLCLVLYLLPSVIFGLYFSCVLIGLALIQCQIFWYDFSFLPQSVSLLLKNPPIIVVFFTILIELNMIRYYLFTLTSALKVGVRVGNVLPWNMGDKFILFPGVAQINWPRL
jgi:hypothetical protein